MMLRFERIAEENCVAATSHCLAQLLQLFCTSHKETASAGLRG